MSTIGEPKFFMIRVCAWCSASLPKVECHRSGDGQISHGMCPVCAEKQLAELAAYRAAKSQKTAA